MARNQVYEMPNVTCTKETDAALLCETPEHGEVWVPKSQIHADSEVYAVDHEGTLVVTQWIAEQKGWV